MNKEWTLSDAAAHWKPMTRAVQHVGVPGHQWQAGVLWDGSLVFGPVGMRDNAGLKEEAEALGNNLLHISFGFGSPMRFADRSGRGSPDVRRSLEEGRLPIPHVETTDGDMHWHEAVFAHLLGRKPEEGMQPQVDDILVVHALFAVTNRGQRANAAHLWLHCGDATNVRLGYKAATGSDLSPAVLHRFESPLGLVDGRVRYAVPGPAKGVLRWHDEVPCPEGTKSPPQRVLEWEVPLRPAEAAEFRILIPYGPMEPDRARDLPDLDSGVLLGEVRGFWQRLLEGTSRMTTPDDFVNDYAVAVAGQMAQQIGYRRRRNVWMYKTSPNHYEAYWPCNAAKALPTLDLRGLVHLSRPVLRSFIEFQQEDVGALTRELRRTAQGDRGQVAGEGFERRPGFLGNFHGWTANTLLLSHGLEIWALASHYRITRDRTWLGEGPGSPLHAIIEGFDWVAAQRRRTMREEGGSKVPHWGLLPAASAHDWLSGNTIFNDAFCIFGMIEAIRLLREIGHLRTEAMAAELNDYRACLRQRYIEARDRARSVPLPDGRQLRYVPRDVGELDWAKVDWTYTGYGPLRAGAWGALDPHDELVEDALAFLEAGMPKGEGFYMRIREEGTADENWRDISDPQAARHYLWRHYVEYETMWPIGTDLFLQRDDLPRFFEFLFHNLAAVLHHPWRVGVESLDGVPSCAPGDGERWRMIRNMFVNERGGYDGSQQSLWLLQAIPQCWLGPGQVLRAEDMRTHFGGAVDMRIEVSMDGKSITVTERHNLAVQPAEIRMRLRSGSGARLSSVEVNGAPVPVLPDQTIRLPSQTRGTFRVLGRCGN